MKLIKNQLIQISNKINKNLFSFIYLIFIFLFLSILQQLLSLLFFSVQQNLLIILILVFSLMQGLYIGFQKNIFNFIDNQPIAFKLLFRYFYLLPKIMVVNIIDFAIKIPLIISYFLILTILVPLDELEKINKTNSSEEFYEQLDKIIAIMQNNVNNIDVIYIIAFTISILLIIIFNLKFWSVSKIIIDKEQSLRSAYKKSFLINNNILQLSQTVSILFFPIIILFYFLTEFAILLYLLGGNIVWNLFWSIYYRKKNDLFNNL